MIVPRDSLSFVALPGRRSADPFRNSDADPPMAMRVVEVGPGERNPHRHPYSHELMYVAEGRGYLWEDGDMQPVTAGDCILIPPSTPHATVAAPGSTIKLICFFPRPDLGSNIEELEGTIALPSKGRSSDE